MTRKYQITRQEAVKRLTARYNEQAEKFPLMRKDISLELYISRNIRAVRTENFLQDYSTTNAEAFGAGA